MSTTYYRMTAPDELTINELNERGSLRDEMATYEIEAIDHAREIKRLPVEALTNLGQVKDSCPSPATDPLEGDTPFPLSPYSASFNYGLRTQQAPDGSWYAVDDDYDGAPDAVGVIVGRGDTEAEAIEDYKDQLLEDFVPVGNYCHNPECDDCRSEERAERDSYLEAK